MPSNSTLLKLQATATKLITKYGNTYKLVRKVNRGGQIVEVTLIPQLYGTFDKQVAQFVQGSGGGVIKSSNKTLLVPVIRFGQIEPQPGDRFIGAKESWVAQNVDVVRPDNSITILYTIEVT